MVIDSSINIFVSVIMITNVFELFNREGNYITNLEIEEVFLKDFRRSNGIAIDSNDNVYVTDGKIMTYMHLI